MKSQIEDLGNVGLVIADWDMESSFPYRTMTIDYSTWTTYISRKAVPGGSKLCRRNLSNTLLLECGSEGYGLPSQSRTHVVNLDPRIYKFVD